MSSLWRRKGPSPPPEPPAAMQYLSVTGLREPGTVVTAQARSPDGQIYSGTRDWNFPAIGRFAFRIPDAERRLGALVTVQIEAPGFRVALVERAIGAGSHEWAGVALELVAPPLERLVIDGTTWRISAGRWRWQGVTAFRLIELVARGERGRAEAYLGEMVAAGVTLVRVLTRARHLFDLPFEVGLAHLAETAALARAADVWMEVVGLADTRETDPATWRTQLAGLGAIANDAPGLIVEVANEPDHATQAGLLRDPGQLAALAALLPTVVPVAYGAAHGPDDESRAYVGGDYVTVHGDRAEGDDGWRWVRHTNEQRALMEEIGKPVVNDEPSRDMADPAKHLALGAFCALFGLGDTFHYASGRDAQLPFGDEIACFAARRRGWAAIPIDWTGTYQNAGFADSPVKSFNGAVRSYSSIAGGAGYTLAFGIGPDFSIEWRAPWTVRDIVIDDATVKLWKVGRT